jgi:hypothetical protein
MDIIGEATESELHRNSMNREEGFCLRKSSWKPLIHILKERTVFPSLDFSCWGSPTRPLGPLYTDLSGHDTALTRPSSFPAHIPGVFLPFQSAPFPLLSSHQQHIRYWYWALHSPFLTSRPITRFLQIWPSPAASYIYIMFSTRTLSTCCVLAACSAVSSTLNMEEVRLPKRW